MKKAERIESWIVYTAAVLLCLALASSWLMGNIYARYTTSSTGSGSARVAKFSVTEADVEGKNSLQSQFSVALSPGEKSEYEVRVTNNSEVAIAYLIEVENKYKNLPLEFQIQKLQSDNNWETLTSADQIPAGDNTARTYKLVVSWPSDKASPDYAGKTDMLIVTLKAVQID